MIHGPLTYRPRIEEFVVKRL